VQRSTRLARFASASDKGERHRVCFPRRHWSGMKLRWISKWKLWGTCDDLNKTWNSILSVYCLHSDASDTMKWIKLSEKRGLLWKTSFCGEVFYSSFYSILVISTVSFCRVFAFGRIDRGEWQERREAERPGIRWICWLLLML
jgi:hypothetical protein